MLDVRAALSKIDSRFDSHDISQIELKELVCGLQSTQSADHDILRTGLCGLDSSLCHGLKANESAVHALRTTNADLLGEMRLLMGKFQKQKASPMALTNLTERFVRHASTVVSGMTMNALQDLISKHPDLSTSELQRLAEEQKICIRSVFYKYLKRIRSQNVSQPEPENPDSVSQSE